jgi:hypothetical protein
MTNPWTLTHYTSADGQPAFSAAIHINDMPTPEREYPQNIRTRTQQTAARLSGPLEEIGRTLQVERDLITGARLDPRKRHSVGVAMRRGEVDPLALRPYQRRSLSADLPKISLIASCGVAELNRDRTYVHRVTQLALALTWACEAIGIEVNAALMEGHTKERRFLSPHQPIREAQLAYILAQPGRFTPLQKYAVTLNRDVFYGVGYAGAVRNNPEMHEASAALQGLNRGSCPALATFPGYDGGNGVHGHPAGRHPASESIRRGERRERDHPPGRGARFLGHSPA